MSYTPTNWQNKPSTTTPISATNLNKLEQGLKTAADVADAATSAVAELSPEAIETVVTNYLAENPPADPTAEQVNPLIEAYVAGNPNTIARPVQWTGPNTFAPSARGSAYIIGVDHVADIGYFTTSGFYLSQSNNIDGTTGTNGLTDAPMPPDISNGANIGKVLRFGNYVYCTAKDSTGFVKVFRSAPATPANLTLAWSAELLTTAGNDKIGTAFNASAWQTGTNYLFLADYGDPSGGPRLYRSADGTTWETVIAQDPSIRHFHAVAADPYTPGHVYATAGDGKKKVVYRSVNSGATWSVIVTEDRFQAVQISFDSKYVWFAGDSGTMTAYVLERGSNVPRIASPNIHYLTSVPGAPGGRGPFADVALTAGSAQITSNTAAFTSADVGRLVRFVGSAAVNANSSTYIVSVQSATQATINKNAGATQSARTIMIDGDIFFRSAFYGAVDPTTGIYYCIPNDATSGGNRSGLFAIPYPGAPAELLEVYSSATPGEIFFWRNSLWCHQVRRPLTTRA